MAGSPMPNVNQLITWATWMAACVVAFPVTLTVTLPVTLTRSGTVVVTALLSAIRGHTAAICVFSCSDYPQSAAQLMLWMQQRRQSSLGQNKISPL